MYPKCEEFLTGKGMRGPTWEGGAFRFRGTLQDSFTRNFTDWEVSLFTECIIFQDFGTNEALRYDGQTDSQKLEVLSTLFQHVPDMVSLVKN